MVDVWCMARSACVASVGVERGEGWARGRVGMVDWQGGWGGLAPLLEPLPMNWTLQGSSEMSEDRCDTVSRAQG